MASIKKFPQSPYFDDFEEESNFLRVLFRPGYSVQTRELNQLQSILQDQIGMVSDYAIENNGRVLGGETAIVKKLPFIKLAMTTTLSYLDYDGATFTTDNGIKGTIQFLVKAEGLDPNTLYVSYESSSTDGMSQAPAANANLTVTLPNGATELLRVGLVNETGFACGVSLNPGIFYIDKSFIRTDRQLVLLNKYSSDIVNEDISVGFLVSHSIVKPETDISLLDNASGTLNESAPGAHRHKSTIDLVDRSTLSPDDIGRYTELVRIINGEAASKPRTDSQFAVLEQILARRTYDESGDYIVDKFMVEAKEHLLVGDNGGVYTSDNGGDESKLVLKFDNGTAYIRGFEVRTSGVSLVNMDKARVTDSASNVIIQNQYKNSITCYNLSSQPQLGSKINLINSTADVIGTAFIRAAQYSGEKLIAAAQTKMYKLDLVAAKFTSGGYAQVASIAYAPTTSATYPLTALVDSFEANASEGSLVYAMPYGYAQSVTPQVTLFNKQISTTSNGPLVTISTGNSSESFDDERSSFIVYANYGTGFVGIPASVTVLDAQNVRLDITNVVGTATPGNVAVRVVAKCFCSAPALRTKTPVTSFINAGLVASARVQLSKADAYKLISVVSSSGVDVTSSYTLDTGSRDTHYDFAAIILKPGEAIPTGTLTVTYSYFEHGATGDFFTTQSYVGIPYSEIPNYASASGNTIFLGSAIDYRQRLTSANEIESVGRGSFVADAQTITNIVYYMPRIDRVMLTQRGEFIVVKGEPSIAPVAPKELNEAITLYFLDVKPYTSTPDAVGIRAVNHRRYTMRDIGKLDARLTTVEEVALLTSLEREVVAEDFEGRFKSGFVVDSFTTGEVADFTSPEFSCARDMVKSHIRPKNVTTFVDVGQSDISAPVGVRLHADSGVTTLDYTERKYIDQPLASSVMRIQPFILYTWDGELSITPATDVWFETQEIISVNVTDVNVTNIFFWGIPPRPPMLGITNVSSSTLSQSSFGSAPLASAWNFTASDWQQRANAEVGGRRDPLALQFGGQVSDSTVNTSVASSSGSNTSAIPFMRSRTISFHATGLKPGTRIYATFDGTDVTRHCTQTGSTLGAAMRVNGNGTISGTFLLPGGVFRTGTRSFRLTDAITPAMLTTSTSAETDYHAVGTLTTITRSISVTNVINSDLFWDPVAQSFFVDASLNPGGVFVSSVDIFLGPIPANNPHNVRVELRKMVNGYPAGKKLASYAYGDVPATGLIGSVDGQQATRFNFKAPVYLAPGEEYAFVTLTNSDVLTMWCCELGAKAYRAGDTVAATGQIISKQAFLGSMFISQNASTWTAEQTKDVKFALNRCEFNPTGQIDFTNKIKPIDYTTQSNIHRRKLQNQPLYFTQGSTSVYVSGWGHGFSVGDKFKLINEGTAQSPLGIPENQIYGPELTVTDVDVFGFSFVVGTAATATGRSGGSLTILDGWAVDYSYAQLISDDEVLESTSIKYNLSTTAKDSYISGATGDIVVSPSDIIDIKSMRAVKAHADNSIKLRATLKTDNTDLSPIIYADRVGINVISNVINDIPTINSDTGLQRQKSSPARYVQKQVSLLTPANELKVILNANIPAGAGVNVYYKVGQSATSEQANWIKMPIDGGVFRFSNDPELFYQQKFITRMPFEFQVFSVLVEFVTSDATKVPVIKDYRALALNV